MPSAPINIGCLRDQRTEKLIALLSRHCRRFQTLGVIYWREGPGRAQKVLAQYLTKKWRDDTTSVTNCTFSAETFMAILIGNITQRTPLGFGNRRRFAKAESPSVTGALFALARPASLSGSRLISRGELFYMRMYAARSIPVGVLGGILPFWLGGKAVAAILFTAAVIQIADVIIAVEKKEWGMIMGASVGAIVHILCGLAIM